MYRDPDGEWKRETFDDPGCGPKNANHVVRQLDAATLPFLMLRGRERLVYDCAIDLLNSTGQPLDLAVAELVERLNLHDTMAQAVEDARENADARAVRHSQAH